MAMWECESCGCKGISHSHGFCPMCRKDREVGKISHGGSVSWRAPEPFAEVTEFPPEVQVEVPVRDSNPEPTPEPEPVPEPVPETPSHADVRAWAKDNGLQVNDRGAVPQMLLDLYTSQNGGV